MRLYSSRSFEGLSLLQRSSGDIKEMSNLQLVSLLPSSQVVCTLNSRWLECCTTSSSLQPVGPCWWAT